MSMDMDTNIEQPEVSRKINTRTIVIVVVTVLVIGAFFAVRYAQYLKYLATTQEDTAQETEGLSPKDQKDLAELDRLRAEYQATFNPPATTSVASQIKSLDALRKKVTPVKQTTTMSEEQQLKELDALRAQAQATMQ